MADRKLTEDYENIVMSLAVSDMLEEYGKELEEKYKDEEDIAPGPEAAEKFEKALNKAYRNGQLRSFRKSAAKFGRHALVVCAALIIGISVSIVTVNAIRLKFLEWLTNIHGTHTSLDITKESKTYDDMVHADYLPDGYYLTYYNNENDEIEIYYSNDINYIHIRLYSENYSFSSDSEDVLLSEEIFINNYKGLYQRKELVSTIYWYNDEKSYWISTDDPNISMEELKKIASSIN